MPLVHVPLSQISAPGTTANPPLPAVKSKVHVQAKGGAVLVILGVMVAIAVCVAVGVCDGVLGTIVMVGDAVDVGMSGIGGVGVLSSQGLSPGNGDAPLP